MNSDPPAAGDTANVAGALALALTDRTSEAIGALTGVAATDAVALSALHHFLDRPSIDGLATVLGLTHSGAVRLVDRLVAARLIRREPGPDNRTTAIALTAKVSEAARAVTDARTAVIQGALAPLSVEDRHALDSLLGRVLVGLVREPGAIRWICRLCDTDACGRSVGLCPVAQEAGRRSSRSS